MFRFRWSAALCAVVIVLGFGTDGRANSGDAEGWTATIVTAKSVPALGRVTNITDSFTFEGRIFVHATFIGAVEPIPAPRTLQVKWFNGDRMVFERTGQATFNKSPYFMSASTSGTVLGSGPCRVEVYVDGQLIGQRTFAVSGLGADTASERVVVPDAIKLDIKDVRPAAEREGFPYPNSSIKHVMYGDQALGLDRVLLLRAKMIERFGPQLLRQSLKLERYYVMEIVSRDSFVKDASGKSIPNTGPYERTLAAQVQMWIDDQPYSGLAELRLPSSGSPTRRHLTDVTARAVESMLKEMPATLPPK